MQWSRAFTILFIASLIALPFLFGSNTQAATSNPLNLTNHSVFTNLISSTADIDRGEAVFEIFVPIDNFKLKDINFGFQRAKGRDVVSYEVFVNTSLVTQLSEVSTYTIVQRNCSSPPALGVPLPVSPSGAFDCSVSAPAYTYYNVTHEGWEKVDTTTKKDIGNHKIKMVNYWSAHMGEQAIDWVPSITFKKTDIGSAQDLEVTRKDWAWQNTSFNNCKNMTVQGDAGEVLANFPFYTNVTFVAGSMQSLFQDIRFVDMPCNGGGNVMPHEFDYVLSNSSAGAWVRTNATFPTGNQSFFSLYYNNSAVEDGQNPSAVWSNNFTAVYHFSEDSGNTLKESRQIFNATNNTGAVAQNQTGGFFGKSWRFGSGTQGVRNDSYNTSALLNISGTQARTVTAFLNFDFNNVLTIPAYVWWGGVSNSNMYASAGWGHSGGNDFAVWGINDDYPSTNNIGTATWMMLSNSYNGSAVRLYVNKTLDSTTATTTLSTTNSVLHFAEKVGEGSDRYNYGGYLDEVQIASVTRSSGWINRTSDNRNLSMFYFGAQEFAPAATDTCTYSSGNWVVACSDNCSIASNVAIGAGSNISITGAGSFVASANITSFTRIYVSGVDATNTCRVRTNPGGGFKR